MLDADLRWHLVTCLARAGVMTEKHIDRERAADPTDLGERHAATARASQPSATAKHAAWQRLIEDRELSHTMSRHIWAGFMHLDQPEVLAPYVERYFDVLDRVWQERSLDWAIGFTAAVFPHAAASPALLDRVDPLLADQELPKPHRRVLLEERDTLTRTLAARSCDTHAADT